MPQSNQSVANNFNPDAQYAALAQRVTGIEGTLTSISTQLGALATAVSERSQTPWSIIFSGAATSLVAISLVGGLIAWGLSTQTSNIVASLADFKQIYSDNRTTSRVDMNAKWAEIDAQLARSVPREEHQQIWLAQTNTDRDQQRQIDELKLQFGSVYGLRDIITDLKNNQEEIRKRLISMEKIQ
jgi:hypothetical protein